MSAPEAIRYHYDNDTRFFALWLDPTLSYSAARWRDPVSGAALAADLAGAQRAKLDFHLTASGVTEGGRLLDVGCGWGAILHRATATYGAGRAVGLTLSNDQLAFVERQGWPNVAVLYEDAFAFETDERFTAAISVGAFEHFAPPGLDRDRKITRYRAFFERLASLLRPAARFSLQTIVWDDVDPNERTGMLPETVFPQSDLPYVEEIVVAAHPAFRLTYVESDPDDYARTLTAWLTNLRAASESIIAQWGEAKYAFFERYLRDSRLGFGRRKTSLARLVFRRR